MTSNGIGITPLDLGLPDRFATFRDIQWEAITQAVQGDKRFQALALPTGTGKTLVAMAYQKITGNRTVILTGTKGLQDQYTRDFGVSLPAQRMLKRMGVEIEHPIVDVRGRANYTCVDHGRGCDDGFHMGCRKCGTLLCPYTAAIYQAREHRCVVTNYKFWLGINRASSTGLQRLPGDGEPNPVHTLVLDEAHLAPEELASFLCFRISEAEIADLNWTLPLSGFGGENMADWKTWAQNWSGPVGDLVATQAVNIKKRVRDLKPVLWQEVEDLRRREAFADKLATLSKLNVSDWICEEKQTKPKGRSKKSHFYWQFDAVWPGAYAERYLFNGVRRVILMSGTIRPKTLSLLGVNPQDAEFTEWPRVFPANRCPVYHLPTVRLNWKSSYHDKLKWVDRIDEIIASRKDRKGIIHTVSYERQAFLMQHSKFAKLMMGNTSDPNSPAAAKVVVDFKAAKPPAILVSPSFSTGWDFPFTECEWQIISKLPFPDGQSKVMKKRAERDPLYLNYTCMQELVQACGRGMRAETDRCETFIVDDSITWFLPRNKKLAPGFFTVRTMAKLPTPAPKLTEQTTTT